MVKHSMNDGYTGDGHRRSCLAVDFDGVIHPYTRGFDDGTTYDPPDTMAEVALTRLLDDGYELVVFSCRPAHQIRDYMKLHFKDPRLHAIEITREKPHAVAYIDDRAHRFSNWFAVLGAFAHGGMCGH